MNLKITYIHPPIPIRSWDYMCYDDETYDGAEDSYNIVGWGPTLEAAKADFMSQWLEHEEERA